MEKAKEIIVSIALLILEGILIDKLLEFTQESLGKHIIEIGLVSAGIIGIAYLIIRIWKH